jgi:multidrug efflux pump subunit AcrA (membrane-fusion protein)
MNVEIKIDAYQDKKFIGKIEFIYPTEKDSQGMNYYEVKINLNDNLLENNNEIKERILDFNILPGMSLEVFIVYEKRKNVISVERGVAKKDDKGYFVQIINKDKSKPIDKKFVNKYFEYGFIGDKYIEIISGLNSGEKIIKFAEILKKK